MNPSLFQINARVLLSELSAGASLRAISDQYLDSIAEKRFDYVYLLGVWQTGVKGREIALTHPDLQSEYSRVLPDRTPADIAGSPFAVVQYSVHQDFGGDGALIELRQRLNARGMKLILDFVPNHVALDHPWVAEAPHRFVRGNEGDLRNTPGNWFQAPSSLILAHGRDPYFAGWSDTAQLNYSSSDLRDAMKKELLRVSELCDGVRCDMAMLLLPHVFRSTWNGHISNDEIPCFWQETIPAVKEKNPSFIFIAEVYWGLEWEMLQRGFDFAYDKTLYDRLLHGPGEAPYSQAHSVRAHLSAPLEYQTKMVRFLENHDEPRVNATVPLDVHKAAALITFFAPGMRFVQRGQDDGKRVKIPVQLGRAPYEQVNEEIAKFYEALLPVVNSEVVKRGSWHSVHARPAWEGNRSHEGFLSCLIDGEGSQLLVAVNYSPYGAQCYLPVPLITSERPTVVLRDLLSGQEYERPTEEVRTKGLYLDVPPWKPHLFSVL